MKRYIKKVPIRSEIDNQDVEKIRKGLLISLKSQELSEVLATKIKQAIHEVFENEKKKGGLMNKEPSLEPMESSIIREALYLLTPQTLIIERQSNPLPFIAYTHPQPP